MRFVEKLFVSRCKAPKYVLSAKRQQNFSLHFPNLVNLLFEVSHNFFIDAAGGIDALCNLIYILSGVGICSQCVFCECGYTRFACSTTEILLSTKSDKFKKYAKKAVAHTSSNSFITEIFISTIHQHFTINPAKNQPQKPKIINFSL